jgi:polyhydroxybutyrate depolymerase
VKFRLALLLAIATLAASASTAAAQGIVMNWTLDGVKREALVFAPSPTGGAAKHPLVFAFHGHGGNMNGAAQGMHIQTIWPEAIVVYPQGLKTPSRIDPQGLRPGWQAEAGQLGDRDLRLFDEMLATMRQKLSVDGARIYATGFSNGAVFSYLLWAARGKTLAAFGICAGRLSPSEHLTEPRPVVVIAGESDPVMPFSYQQQTIEADRQVDSATGPGQPCGPLCTLFPSTTQTPVKSFIHPGGHVYPPWAASAIVDFLKAHKHP